MPALQIAPLILLLWSAEISTAVGSRAAGERRPRLQADECAQRGLGCERRCNALRGAEKLSCQTECRLAASRCRSGRR